MRRLRGDDGYGLIMLIGLTAALAILAAMLVMMVSNRQHTAYTERNTKTSLYYAEAGLNSAMTDLENDTSWLTSSYAMNTTALNADYTSLSGAPTVTYSVYDNLTPVNTAVTWDSNGDGKVWVQATVTWDGRTTKVRQLLCSSTTVSVLPLAAAWTDTNMTLSGTSNIYAVTASGANCTSPPYETTVMVGGNFTGTSSSTLADPGQTAQSLGLQVDGSVSGVPSSVTHTTGGVGLLSDYFNGAEQMNTVAQAQLAISNQSTLFDSAGTSVTSSTTPYTTWTSTSSQTWTAPSGTDYVVPSSCNSGNLTIAPASGKVSTFTFNKLWVAGNLTISGNATVNTTGLYVGGNLTITGTSAASITDDLGPIYVVGKVLWEGAYNCNTTTLSVSTATTAAPSSPQPMFCKILSVDGDMTSGNADNQTYDTTNKPGPTAITLGDLWVDGDAGTGDIAVNFSGPSAVASTVMCTVLATTEQTHSNGDVNFGSLAQPMVYFMVCDNDSLYSNTMQWNDTGTYYGVMILFEAEDDINSGSIVGAVLEGCPKASDDTGTDITMSGSATICYNPTIINNINIASLKTTTVAAMPGTLQEIAGE
jgi:Tfp pilus assembly protein PilX